MGGSRDASPEHQREPGGPATVIWPTLVVLDPCASSRPTVPGRNLKDVKQWTRSSQESTRWP